MPGIVIIAVAIVYLVIALFLTIYGGVAGNETMFTTGLGMPSTAFGTVIGKTVDTDKINKALKAWFKK
jgi:uncharacterized membrane protein YqiK